MRYRKLRGKIVEKYGTASAFAEKIGIAPSHLSLKLVGKIGLSQKEILEWSRLLGIDKREIGEIFFED